MVYKYREVRGTFTALTPDTTDADEHPNIVPLSGSVVLTPIYKDGGISFSESGHFDQPQPKPAAIDPDGILRSVVTDPATGAISRQPLFLPVTVDERANQEWTYEASFPEVVRTDTGELVNIPTKRFAVEPGDGPLNLVAVATTKHPGMTITKGAPGAGLLDIAAANGEIVFSWDNGKSTTIEVPDNVPGPRGPEGPPGSVELTGVVPEISVGTDYVRVGGREVVQAGDVGAGMPVLASLSRAQLWEATHPGRKALWVDGETPDDTGALPAYFDAETGVAPARWTPRFATGAKIPELADDGYLSLTHSSAARWALTHDDTGDAASLVDVVMRMRSPRTSSGGFSFGIIVGQSGTSGAETGTTAYFNYGSGQSPMFRLVEYVDGGSGSPLTAPAPDFTEWTWMRLNVGDDGWTRVRVWSDTEDEPDGWTQSTSLISVKSGRVGIFNPGNSDAHVSYYNVRTDGTPAPIVVL